MKSFDCLIRDIFRNDSVRDEKHWKLFFQFLIFLFVLYFIFLFTESFCESKKKIEKKGFCGTSEVTWNIFFKAKDRETKLNFNLLTLRL